MIEWRFAGALPIAGVVAVAARRAGSLTASGAVAAAGVGAVAVAAGWPWAVLLIVYFAASTALSRLGRARKEKLTSSIVAKRGPRDAWQVMANGFAFGVAALGSLSSYPAPPDPGWFALGAGALAASAADTWATEIGILYGGTPRSVLHWRPVPAGTSGAVSLVGSVGALLGALTIGVVVLVVGGSKLVAGAAVIGGLAGALLDSLLGATVQSRLWCDRCGVQTEREVHDCGRATYPIRGMTWIDNDLVNFLAGIAGGLLSVFVGR
jgi:uncharacterized protein (TIGR00297 family)